MMGKGSTTKVLKSVSAILGAICLLAVVGASDAEIIGLSGVAAGLSSGIVLLMIGTVPERIRLSAEMILRRVFRRLYSCLSYAGVPRHERRSLSRAGGIEILIEPAVPCGQAEEYYDAQLHSKCS